MTTTYEKLTVVEYETGTFKVLEGTVAFSFQQRWAQGIKRCYTVRRKRR